MARAPNVVNFDRVRVYVVDMIKGIDMARTQIISKEAYDLNPQEYGKVSEIIPAGTVPEGESA